MATKIITNRNRLNAAEQILESITEPANTVYYLFTADHLPDSSNTFLEDIYDTEKMKLDVYRNMIFGKRIEEADLKIMVRNIPYVSNVVYDHYDDSDVELYTKNYYVVVNAASTYHVFKCLDNNDDSPSTVEPNFSHISGSNSFVYETSDGYRWKYMYSADSANVNKFETSSYFPIIANTDVENSAVDGAIDIILVDGEGRGYDNFYSSIFDSSEIKINGDSSLFKISGPSVSSVNGFYTGCLIYISTGTGAGQYRTISDFYSNNLGNYIIVNTEFSTVPDNTSEYEIYPEVKITGDGRESETAVARALVNSLASNSIYRVEVLNRGRGYQYHHANVIANSVVEVDNLAIVRSVYSPYGGHGSDPGAELGARHLSFTVRVSNTESNTIPINNYFRKVGIIKDPLFANVGVEIANLKGSFIAGEKIFKINPVKLLIDGSVTSTNVLTSATGDFENQFSAGDYIYLKSPDDTLNMLTTVSSITNSSQLYLSVNAYFSCTATYIYKANVSAEAYVSSVNTTVVSLTNVNGQILSNDSIIGLDSGSRCTVNSISRNGNNKTYDTFINMYKYVGTLINENFQENEIVYQTSINNANALLHSSTLDGSSVTFYTTNQIGQFVTSTVVTGANSGATASILNKYFPEIVFNSGDILFIENIDKVTRSANTNETFQIIFEF